MEPELNTLGGDCNECRNLEKEVERLREENKRLREALGRAIQGYRNLIEYKVLPHVGWDKETEKYIAEIEKVLEGGGE